jgi:hypothetical protein
VILNHRFVLCEQQKKKKKMPADVAVLADDIQLTWSQTMR